MLWGGLAPMPVIRSTDPCTRKRPLLHLSSECPPSTHYRHSAIFSRCGAPIVAPEGAQMLLSKSVRDILDQSARVGSG